MMNPPLFNQKQEATARLCPQCGSREFLMHSLPPAGVIALAESKCLRCNCWWQINSAGQVTKILVAETVEVCPKCLKPWGVTAAHTCKKLITKGESY